jgi:ribosomal protein L22
MIYFVKQRYKIGGMYMREQELQEIAIQKSLELSKQDALKVLVFITGMQAEKELQSVEDMEEVIRERRCEDEYV